MARSAIVALLAALALASCTRRALTVSVDGGVDAAGTDGDACGLTHEYRPIPLTSLATLDGSAQYRDYSPLRFVIGYTLRAGCDVPADVSIVTEYTSPGVLLVSLLTYGWLGSTSCGAPVELTRVVTTGSNVILDDEPTVLVEDGGPNATLPTLMLTSAGPAPTCANALPGAACNSDCDCPGYGMSCLIGSDGMSRCGRPCNDDVDCGNPPPDGPATPSCEGAPSYICGASAACRQPEDCGYAETVSDCLCTRPPPEPPEGTTPPSCGCDADCPTGTICNGQWCIIPCNDIYDCPGDCTGDVCSLCNEGVCPWST